MTAPASASLPVSPIDQRVYDLYDEYCHGGMDRRTFLSTAGCLPAAGLIATSATAAAAEDAAAQSQDSFTAGSGSGPVFAGSPVVTGPAAEAIWQQLLAKTAAGG